MCYSLVIDVCYVIYLAYEKNAQRNYMQKRRKNHQSRNKTKLRFFFFWGGRGMRVQTGAHVQTLSCLLKDRPHVSD